MKVICIAGDFFCAFTLYIQTSCHDICAESRAKKNNIRTNEKYLYMGILLRA